MAAVQRQASRGSCFGLPTEAEIDLAELIVGRVKSIESIRFTNSGSEAVMQAVKAARAFTGRTLIAKCEGAYHGSYDWVEVSVDSSSSNWGDPNAPERVAYNAGTPSGILADVVVIPFNDSVATRELLLSRSDQLAAIVVDVLPNRLGFPQATPEFLATLRECATSTGALLIADEIITFRLSAGGAQDLHGVSPDLTTLGKLIGGGYPIGAVGGSAEVMTVFDETPAGIALHHGGTFNANPVSMVAGEATLAGLGSEEFDRLGRLGAAVRVGMTEALARSGRCGSVTGEGSLFRFHIGDGTVYDYRSMKAQDRKAVGRISRSLLEAGILIGQDGLGCVSTVMTDAHVDQLLQAFAMALEEVA